MSIKLLGAEWEAKPPASFVVRHEITMAYRPNVEPWRQIRVWGAALGVTWAHPKRRLETTMAQCAHDPQVYGEAVANELQALGVSAAEIAIEGAEAFNVIVAASIPSADEVETRAGFSDPVGGKNGPTGSSPVGNA